LLLALGTWSVYIGDRLLDVRAAQRSGEFQGLRERHHFHERHRRILLAVAACAASAAMALIFIRMPVALREPNSVLAVAALAYFTGVHSTVKFSAWCLRFIAKEFLVGVLFTAGCAFPVFSGILLFAKASSPHWPIFAEIAFFALLAWLNCRAIECWESASALRIYHHAAFLALAGLTMTEGLVLIQPRTASLLMAASASALLLAILDRGRHRLTPLALRIAADLVLLTPIFLIPFARHQQ
jgi:hypothetical protein